MGGNPPSDGLTPCVLRLGESQSHQMTRARARAWRGDSWFASKAALSQDQSKCWFQYVTWKASDARNWPQALTTPHRALVKWHSKKGTRPDIMTSTSSTYIMMLVCMVLFQSSHWKSDFYAFSTYNNCIVPTQKQKLKFLRDSSVFFIFRVLL